MLRNRNTQTGVSSSDQEQRDDREQRHRLSEQGGRGIAGEEVGPLRHVGDGLQEQPHGTNHHQPQNGVVDVVHSTEPEPVVVGVLEVRRQSQAVLRATKKRCAQDPEEEQDLRADPQHERGKDDLVPQREREEHAKPERRQRLEPAANIRDRGNLDPQSSQSDSTGGSSPIFPSRFRRS